MTDRRQTIFNSPGLIDDPEARRTSQEMAAQPDRVLFPWSGPPKAALPVPDAPAALPDVPKPDWIDPDAPSAWLFWGQDESGFWSLSDVPDGHHLLRQRMWINPATHEVHAEFDWLTRIHEGNNDDKL